MLCPMRCHPFFWKAPCCRMRLQSTQQRPANRCSLCSLAAEYHISHLNRARRRNARKCLKHCSRHSICGAACQNASHTSHTLWLRKPQELCGSRALEEAGTQAAHKPPGNPHAHRKHMQIVEPAVCCCSVHATAVRARTPTQPPAAAAFHAHPQREAPVHNC